MMDRKVKSFRLRTDLLSWVESYAAERGSTQVAVLEQALESLRADAEGGVPDLPVDQPIGGAGVVVAVPVSTPAVPVVGVTTARQLLERGVSLEVMARQRKLNEAAARARSAPKGRS
jgi:hypothetical protein